jgi:hypothetical protein
MLDKILIYGKEGRVKRQEEVAGCEVKSRRAAMNTQRVYPSPMTCARKRITKC